VEDEWIFTTHGLVNGTALCVQAFTQPGEGVVLFTPVYHAFARVIRAAGRQVVEVPLVERDGRMTMEFPANPARRHADGDPVFAAQSRWAGLERRGTARCGGFRAQP
jgi:aspartate/methionine/tyrosine aminotransferase